MRACILALVCCATPALADLEVRFIEGAPVDRFTFTPSADCPIGPATLVVDLTASQGKLIFATTERGAGVEVYQPFRLTSGADQVVALPDGSDGARGVSLDLASLSSGLSFTIDVDDTLGQSETRVSGSEITDAQVHLVIDGTRYSASFDATARANLDLPACLS